MPRPVIFFDLAGTLEQRDPRTGRWGPWPGAGAVLSDLAGRFDLHLTTGESPRLAGPTLSELGLHEHFTGIHAGLEGGGKPFGTLAGSLGVPAERCLAVGDSAVSDTAGDTDRVVSVILARNGDAPSPRRLGAVVGQLWSERGFLAGFESALLAAAGAEAPEAGPGRLGPDALHASTLGGGCRLGWWRKTTVARRAVVLLTA